MRCIHYEEIENIIDIWNNYSAVIAMRFHSIVLSIITCTPFVPIAYGHKAVNLANLVGMNDYILKWSLKGGYFLEENDISSKSIIDKLYQVLNDSLSIHEILQGHSAKLKGAAENAFLELCSNLNQ